MNASTASRSHLEDHGASSLLPACREVTRLISLAMDQPLTWRRRLAVRLHVMICTWCKRYQRQLDLMRRMAHSTSIAEMPINAAAKLPSGARERISKALK